MIRFSALLQILWFGLSLNVLPALSDEQVYQWQENDKTFFSDHPHANAKIFPIKIGYSFYNVKRVLDGDTLQLDNDTRIRLLGLNTPEVGGRYKTTEPGGEQAKQWLKQQLQGQRVRLETDMERQDKYQRSLAHVFTETGRHINLELVRNGLATVNIYPPNLKYVNDLTQAEQLAEKQHLGLWNEPAYAIKPVAQIDNFALSGWQRLSGTANSMHNTAKYIYLDFSERFSIRIARANLYLFPDLKTYLGHNLEIRGWLNQQQEGYSMLIRHPHAIKFIS